MGQPQLTTQVYFGNNAQPNGQGSMPWLFLNDGSAWKVQDYQVPGDNRQIGLAQLPFLGRGVYISDDFAGKVIAIPARYVEATAGDFGAQKAKLSQAGEQWLTTDNKVTGALAKLKSFGTPKIVRSSGSLLYQVTLEFLLKEPWFRDLLPMGTVSGNPSVLFGQIEDLQSGFEAPSLQVGGTTLWHTLGNEAGTDNSITYWNNINGGSYASHLVTLLKGGGMTGGHLDWDDGTWQVRFKWVTGTFPTIFSRLPSRASVANGVLAWVDSANFHMAVGFADAGEAFTSFVPVNGTFYWMSIQMNGNTATARLYNDSAGARGALVKTLTFDASVGHSTALQPRGCVGIGEVGGAVDNCQFGGAFSMVATFVGPWPSIGGVDWSIGQGTGESAFCWSRVNPFAGGNSISIYNAAAGGQGYSVQTIAHSAATYTISSKCKGTGTPANFCVLYAGNVPANVTADGTWRDCIQTAAYSAGGWPDQVSCVAFGAGTYYFDNVILSRQISSVSGVPYYQQQAIDKIGLSGAVAPGSLVSWTWSYPGSVRAEPIFQLNVPVGNTVVINQLILKNLMSGEQLVITFNPPIPANTARTITIDGSAMSVIDDTGASHDFVGSFPMLYGPAGQNQGFTATLITASGTSTGVTLDSKWFNKWEV